jgi:hypothetical protein
VARGIKSAVACLSILGVPLAGCSVSGPERPEAAEPAPFSDARGPVAANDPAIRTPGPDAPEIRFPSLRDDAEADGRAFDALIEQELNRNCFGTFRPSVPAP